nr:unnamed protein product [Callosobruchus analis]
MGLKGTVTIREKRVGKECPLSRSIEMRKKGEMRYNRLDHLVVYQEKQTRCNVCHKN